VNTNLCQSQPLPSRPSVSAGRWSCKKVLFSLPIHGLSLSTPAPLYGGHCAGSLLESLGQPKRSYLESIQRRYQFVQASTHQGTRPCLPENLQTFAIRRRSLSRERRNTCTHGLFESRIASEVLPKYCKSECVGRDVHGRVLSPDPLVFQHREYEV